MTAKPVPNSLGRRHEFDAAQAGQADLRPVGGPLPIRLRVNAAIDQPRAAGLVADARCAIARASLDQSLAKFRGSLVQIQCSPPELFAGTDRRFAGAAMRC